MRRAIKGFLLWILNNSSLITFNTLFIDFCDNPSSGAFFRFMFVAILWFITGCMLVVAFVDAEKRHIKKGVIEQELLSYSFIDNSILLSAETIQKNGFYEIWRQENDEHSIQILCFNNETKQFQAFDRFHWMDEPYDTTNYFSSCVFDKNGNVIKEPWIEPEGTYWKKDLWTPIELNYTTEWLKEHVK